MSVITVLFLQTNVFSFVLLMVLNIIAYTLENCHQNEVWEAEGRSDLLMCRCLCKKIIICYVSTGVGWKRKSIMIYHHISYSYLLYCQNTLKALVTYNLRMG